jgi:hypothetical protein
MGQLRALRVVITTLAKFTNDYTIKPPGVTALTHDFSLFRKAD